MRFRAKPTKQLYKGSVIMVKKPKLTVIKPTPISAHDLFLAASIIRNSVAKHKETGFGSRVWESHLELADKMYNAEMAMEYND